MIKLIVSYDFIEKEDSKLYNKELSQDINEKKVSIKGYMPYNAGIKVTEVSKSEAESKINEGITDATSSVNLAVAYDIKIIVDEKEYEPEEFDEKVVVSITGFKDQSVNVWHIKNDNTVEKMDTTETTFETNSFSIYGVEVLEENENQSSETSQTPQEEPKNEIKVEDKNSTLLRVIRTEATNEDEIFTINDYNSDYSYYIGKNFTDNTSGNNSGTYTSSNLAKVTINYYGYGYVNNNANNTVKGRISVSETQDIVKHIKCVPIVNNRVFIELLDNPFMDKPGGYGFGGWKSSDGTITTDSNTNTQTISASASSEMTLNIYVNWASAKVVYVNPDEGADDADTGLTEDSPFGSWGKACDYLYNNSTDRNNRELNIIVLTGPIDTSVHYTRPTYQTQVSDAEYTSNTTFTSGNSYLLATGQGEGSNAIITSGSSIQNTQLQTTNVSLGNYAEWTITASGNGYTIRNRDTNRYYLTCRVSGNNSASLTLSSSSFTWSYSSSNRCFYYQSGNRTYYLYYSNGTWTISRNSYTSLYFLTYQLTNTRTGVRKSDTVSSNSYYSSNTNLALTITSVYNGSDYRDDATIDLTATSAQADFNIYNDFQMNHVAINSTGYTSNDDGTSFETDYAWLLGNGYNVRIGRGIECSDTSTSGCTFANIIGGAASTSSSDAYKLVVESGKYSSIQGFNRYSGGTVNYYGTVYLTLGNDIDRIARTNDNMSVYYRTTINSGGGLNGTSTNEKAWLINVKSGKYGVDFFDANINSTNSNNREDCAYAGIYMGGYGTSSGDSTKDRADRYMLVEGGKIANAIGGLKTTSGTTIMTKMYIKGGEIYNIVGGAGISTTYGNRIIQVTGGTINYSISGGSNGYASTGSGQEGKIENCNTLVYIGGTAQIGDTDNVDATPIASLYNVEAGCVLGAGNGKSGITDTGRVDNTHIIINENAHILNSIYGGGNIGTVGSSSGTNATAVIDILGGTIDKNVYGGSNSNSIYGTTTINIKGGQVKGAIYGGANSTGTVYSGSTVNVTGGTLGTTGNTSGVLFGGGKGSDTVIMQNANVNISDGDGNVNIYGNSYGGSEQGSVRGQATVTYNTASSIVSGNDYLITYNNNNMLSTNSGGTSVANETRSTTEVPSSRALWRITSSGNKYTIYNAAANKYLCCTTSSSGWGGTTVSLGLQDQEYEWSYDSNNKRFYTSITTTSFWGGTQTNDYYLRYNNGWSVNTSTNYTSLTFQTYTVQSDSGSTLVNINDSSSIANTINIVGNVFAGGQGTSTNTAQISGNATINVDGSNLPNASIFGGNDVNGVTNGNITVNIGNTHNSTVGNVYGGGNEDDTGTEADTVKVYLLSHANVTNAFNGGKSADLITSNSSDTTRAIYLQGGHADNIYGGSNTSGTVTGSHVYIESGTATNVYGGNNQGGTVNNSYVEISGGTVGTVYGGNNDGGTTTTSNVFVNGGNVTNAYGGGNNAVTNLTNITVEGNIINNVFGGGNMAGVTTNTNVKVKNATIGGSVFGGGNGLPAIVNGDTNVIIHGTGTEITDAVFGGGNQAATGTNENNNSTSTVNIVGGKIGGNVYGGANTSVVYGNTVTNIGYDTVTNNNSLTKGDIEIEGTVFGGGEANASGSENYDFSFISVTQGTEINIDGNGHTKYTIKGSIFGSGNASSSEGDSYLNIKNYGTAENPKHNISLQRATLATIDNSAIVLAGATDRTNEYKTVLFSISRVDEVKLKNNSTLYLANGANLLTKLDSVAVVNGTEQKGTFEIDEQTGEVTKNVDNRIYMLEGKNLNIATNEQVTAYGQVSGMFFLGLFTNKNSPSSSNGFYNAGYDNGEEITNEGTFSLNSYALAEHMDEHNIYADGFYTNYNEEGIIKQDYIGVTPEDDVYYIWMVGEALDVTTFEMDLIASKYATLGTYELLLQGFSDPNIRFTMQGFSAGMEEGISLVEPESIQSIEPDEDTANSVYGLSMKTGNLGWRTSGNTTFLSRNGGSYSGTRTYMSDSSTYTPTLNFCFYHSQNLSIQQPLGEVRIRFQVQTPVDDLNYSISYIDIVITMTTKLFQDDFYEAAITPGQEFGLFTSTETSITSNSTFSTYYSLFINNFSDSDYYEDYSDYHRALVSRDANDLPYVFPLNTKITMLDMVTQKYYYYIVSASDITNNKYVYNLSDFIAMGSEDDMFNELAASNIYYNSSQNLIYENYIFQINFSDANISDNIINNSLLMELRDNTNQTLIGVLGIQRDVMKYSVYSGQGATISISNSSVDPGTVYIGNTFNLNATTELTQRIVNSKTVYDTQFFDKKLGLKISFYDSNGTRVNNDSLLGINFELDGQRYYPRVDGTTRICIADKVTKVLAKMKVNTQDNTTLASGDYVIKIESFGSADGIYYGLEASDLAEINVRIINDAYGLKVITRDQAKIIDKTTGKNEDGTNQITSTVNYSSKFTNPSISICLYRRNYDEEYSNNYTLVDLQDYISDILTPTNVLNEYLITNTPSSSNTNQFNFKTELKTGTYKLVYKLYDSGTYVGEAYEYIVIK